MSGTHLCLIVFLTVVSNQFAVGALDSFWSLGVTTCATEDSVSCPTCAKLEAAGTLNMNQRRDCSSNAAPIRGIAKGTRKAILDCQQQFSSRKWNCSTFFGADLFGSFVTNARTRETAALFAYLTAGAVQGVSEACHDQAIPECPCGTGGLPPKERDEDDNTIYHVCNYNLNYALKYIEDFVIGLNDISNTDLDGRSDIHNIEVGKQIADHTEEFCTCHGLSGACTVQTCYLKGIEVRNIGESIVTKYDGAVQVDLDSDNNELRRVDVTGADPLSSLDLAFVEPTPDLCVADIANGILGTKDRACDPNPGTPKSCSVLCCGRGHYRQSYTVPVEKCKFVWCCEIKCTVTHNETISNYKCK